MLTYFQLDPYEQIKVNFDKNIFYRYIEILIKKNLLKRCLKDIDHWAVVYSSFRSPGYDQY